jgi:hypothetical protein
MSTITSALGVAGALIIGFLFLFLILCTILMPVFVWGINDKLTKTNRLLQEILDVSEVQSGLKRKELT